MTSGTKPSAALKPRAYLIEEYTITVCPQCFAERQRRSDEDTVFVDGMLVRQDGRIYMKRFCKEHGETESLYEENAEIWKSRNGWQTPTLEIVPDRQDNFGAFPEGYRNGLPASHGQHTCILVLNINKHCNYTCTTCYASALPLEEAKGRQSQAEGFASIDQIYQTVSAVLEREHGKLGVLMLSGGEPTIRADLEELIDRLLPLNINRIMINTNGRRIARDKGFLNFLKERRDRIEVYLQFDGFRPQTYLILRNEDVSQEKRKALELLNEAGIFTTLVCTVAKGVNDDEVGAVLRHGLDLPFCSGMAIQPVFGSGRVIEIDPLNRSTPTGVLANLGEQTGGLVSASDFIPLPCSHKDCCDITYMIKDQNARWTSLPTLVGRENLRSWISLVSNTISFETIPPALESVLKEGILQRLLSEQQKMSSANIAQDIARVCQCIPGLDEKLGRSWQTACSGKLSAREAAENAFRITVKMFMDTHTFHAARIRQCCVHTGTFEKDPRRYSFCWRWLFADADEFPEMELH